MPPLSQRVCQTYDRMLFGRLSFCRTRWYAVTVGNPQMVRVYAIRESLETTALTLTPEIGLLWNFCAYNAWILLSSNLERVIDVCSFFRLSEFFLYPLLGRVIFRGRCWAAIRLFHRPEPSGRAVRGEVDGLDIGGRHGRRFVLLRHTHRP